MFEGVASDQCVYVCVLVQGLGVVKQRENNAQLPPDHRTQTFRVKEPSEEDVESVILGKGQICM